MFRGDRRSTCFLDNGRLASAYEARSELADDSRRSHEEWVFVVSSHWPSWLTGSVQSSNALREASSKPARVGRLSRRQQAVQGCDANIGHEELKPLLAVL